MLYICLLFITGRNYNISVQTVSNGEISLPTTAQYRTVPLRPRNVTFERRLVTSDSFQIRWEEPKGMRYCRLFFYFEISDTLY